MNSLSHIIVEGDDDFIEAAFARVGKTQARVASLTPESTDAGVRFTGMPENYSHSHPPHSFS